MLSTTEYLLAWALYLLGAVVLMATVWRLTRRWWAWIKDPLRAVTAVLLLTPAGVDADGKFLAPAAFVAAFELLTAEGGGIGALLGVRLLLFAMIAVLAAWLLRLLWYWLVARRRAPRRASALASAAAGPAAPGAGATALRAVDVRERAGRRSAS